MNDNSAISVSGLVKTFGRTLALDGLNLSVQSGEVHGFLGPNGAGKSTTLRVLLGLIRKDSGKQGFWAATPGATLSYCTAVSPMYQETLHSGRDSRVGR